MKGLTSLLFIATFILSSLSGADDVNFKLGDLSGPTCSPYAQMPCVKPLDSFWSNGMPKVFENVLVLNGLGLDLGIHMGMIDAAEDLGRKPDLIVGSCGGSVSISIHQAYPNREERLEFVTSPTMHRFLLNPYTRTNDRTVTKWQYFKILIGSYLRKMGVLNSVQNYFPFEMADIKSEEFPEELRVPFGSGEGPRYIALGARTTLNPESIKNATAKGMKYYKEVLFTDSETGKYLEGYRSPIGVYFPNAFVEEEVAIKTGLRSDQVVRAAVSDPYVFAPTKLDDGYYLTGGVNLNPIELAMGLGRNVTFAFRDGFDANFNAVTDGGAFRYDTRNRQRLVSSSNPTHWVDLSDRSYWNGIGFSVTDGLTEDSEKFKETVLKQYILGYLRTAEAICLSPGYKGHLRGAGHLELDPDVLESIRTRDSQNPQECKELVQLQAELEAKFGVKLGEVAVKEMTPIHHRPEPGGVRKWIRQFQSCASALMKKI